MNQTHDQTTTLRELTLQILEDPSPPRDTFVTFAERLVAGDGLDAPGKGLDTAPWLRLVPSAIDETLRFALSEPGEPLRRWLDRHDHQVTLCAITGRVGSVIAREDCGVDLPSHVPWPDTASPAPRSSFWRWGLGLVLAGAVSGLALAGPRLRSLAEVPRAEWLHRAVETEDTALARVLLVLGWEPGCTNDAGWTPLHRAAAQGRVPLVRFLLGQGAPIDAEGQGARTPLHEAARNGRVEAATALLDNGANTGATDRSGRTPLHEAVLGGHGLAVDVLLSRIGPLTFRDQMAPAVRLAIVGGYIPIVRTLVDAVEADSLSSYQGMRLLEEAAARGHLEIVDILLTAGAWPEPPPSRDGDTGDDDGEYTPPLIAKHTLADTPLGQAVVNGHVDVATRLLTAGATFHPDVAGTRRLLHRVAVTGRTPMAALLLDNGFDVNAASPPRRGEDDFDLGFIIDEDLSTGGTPLHFAASHGRAEMLSFLLSRGATIDAVDARGRTVLHHAVDSAVPRDVLEILLDHGADPTRSDAQGKPPLGGAGANKASFLKQYERSRAESLDGSHRPQ